jgi:hypothetical protein
MSNKRSQLSSLATGLTLALLTLALTGCTETRKVKFIPSALPARAGTAHLPATGALVLDDAFKKYNGETKLIGGKAKIPLGEYLCDYATNVVRSTFKQVNVVSSLPAAANSADAILIPKVVRSDFSIFSTTSIIAVEWTVKDRAGQNLIWLNTFEGQGTEPGGSGFTYKKHNRLRARKVFDDLTLKTLEGFNESPEIKRLAEQPK